MITLHDKYMPRELFSEKEERKSARARKEITNAAIKKGTCQHVRHAAAGDVTMSHTAFGLHRNTRAHAMCVCLTIGRQMYRDDAYMSFTCWPGAPAEVELDLTLLETEGDKKDDKDKSDDDKVRQQARSSRRCCA